MLDMIWPNKDGKFSLYGGFLGNPGCDECGEEDAVVHVDGTYLCLKALMEWRAAGKI